MPRSEIIFTKEVPPQIQKCRDDAARQGRWKSFKTVADLEKPIKDAMANSRRVQSKAIFFIGQQLIEGQKRLARYGEGTFIRWCHLRLGLKKSTAYKLIRVGDRFGDCPQYAQSIAPSALYLLSEANTPAQARHEAIEEAKQGGEVSLSRAKHLVEKAFHGNPKLAKRRSREALDEMRLCWRRFAELWAAASEDQLRRFDKWRRESPKAKLATAPGFVGIVYVGPSEEIRDSKGRVYGDAAFHAARRRRQVA